MTGHAPALDLTPEPPPGQSPADTRRPFRVFLACSLELEEERAGFSKTVARLNDLPHVRRAYDVQAVRWDTDAFGFDERSTNNAIARSIDFDRLDVVVVVVWNHLGAGTREEYERARDLAKRQPKPKLLVFIRNPMKGNGVAAAVADFRERVFADNGVPIPYDTPQEFFALLQSQIAPIRSDPIPVERVPALVRSFTIASWTLIAVAASVVALTRYVSFPDRGVNTWTILAIIASPVVLLAGTLRVSQWHYRLSGAFRAAWRSPAYTDSRLWIDFLPVIPSWAMPRYLRLALPRSLSRDTWTTLLLLLAFLAGPIASYQAVFQEVVLWERAVGWHAFSGPDGSVVSRFVDRDRRPWPFGLQDPEAREVAAASPDEVVYVHAHQKFCRPDQQAEGSRFRCNLGPELKTLYVWLLLVAFLLSAFLACAGLIQVGRLRQTAPH